MSEGWTSDEESTDEEG